MQQYIVSGLCLVVGVGAGVMLAPKNVEKVELPAKKEIGVRGTKPSVSTGMENDLEIVDRVLWGSQIDRELLGNTKTAKDWIELIRAQKLDSGDMMTMQKRMMDIGLLLRMVPDKDLPAVVAEVEKMSQKGNMMSRGLWTFYAASLSDRWFSSDPGAMKEWALRDGGAWAKQRKELLVIAALEHNPEEGLLLFKEYKDDLRSGAMAMFGGLHPKIAGTKLKVEGVEAYWEYYDSLPSRDQRRLGYGGYGSIEKGEYEKFYNEGKKRWAEKEGSFGRSNGRFFSAWGQNDPSSLVKWYRENQPGIKSEHKATALQGLFHSGEERAFLKEELTNDATLVESFMSRDRTQSDFGGGSGQGFEEKLKLLPEGTKITGTMVQEEMSNYQWSDPVKGVEMANYITNQKDRYETLKNVLASSRYQKKNEADVAEIKGSLSKVGLTADQQEALGKMLTTKDPAAEQLEKLEAIEKDIEVIKDDE